MSHDLAVITPESPALPLHHGPRSVTLRSLQEIERFAELVHNTSLVPKEYRGKKGDVVGIIFFGLEIGLNPLQALQGIMFVNGRPSVWGDTMLGLVRASGLLQELRETPPDEAQATGTASCTVVRRGEPPTVRVFTQAMAEKARLWGKDIWAQYPGRMLQMRARSWALRDAFPDVLKGLMAREEAQDIDMAPDSAGTYRAAPPERGTSEVGRGQDDEPGEPAADAASAALVDEAQQALIHAISDTLLTVHPGNHQEAKLSRSRLLYDCFEVRARHQLAGLAVPALQAGYQALQALVGRLEEASAEVAMDDDANGALPQRGHAAEADDVAPESTIAPEPLQGDTPGEDRTPPGQPDRLAEEKSAAPRPGESSFAPLLTLPNGQTWDVNLELAPPPDVDADGEVPAAWMGVLVQRAQYYGTEAHLRDVRRRDPAFSRDKFTDAWEQLARLSRH